MLNYWMNVKNDTKQKDQIPKDHHLYQMKTREYSNTNMNKSSGFIKKAIQSNQQQKSPQKPHVHKEQLYRYDKKTGRFANEEKGKQIKQNNYWNYDPRLNTQKQNVNNKDTPYLHKKNYDMSYNNNDWKVPTNNYPNDFKEENKQKIFKDINNVKHEQNKSDIGSSNQQSKRQNMRHKDFQFRMNNIENINGKINDLLNLVHNKGQSRGQWPKSQIKNTTKTYYDKLNTSPYNKKYPNYAEEVKQFNLGQINKTINVQKIKESQNEHNQDRYRQRLRTVSNVDPVLVKNNMRKRQLQNIERTKEDYIKIDHQYYKQRSPSNYSPSYQKNKQLNKYAYNYNKPQINVSQHIRQNLQTEYFKSPKNVQRSPVNANANKNQYTFEYQMKNRPLNSSMEKYRIPSSIEVPSPSNIKNDGYLPISLMKPYNKSDLINKSVNNELRQIRSRTKDLQVNNHSLYEGLSQGRYKQVHQRQRSKQKAQKHGRSANKTFQIKLLPVIYDKQETIKVAQNLLNQIEKDSFFLKKIQLQEEYLQGQQFWKDLQSLLNKNGVKLTSFQIKQLIKVEAKQYSNQNVQNIQNVKKSIVDQLTLVQKHWEQEIGACATIRLLKNENFSVSNLDGNKKGYLSIEDLCDFVHDYTGRTIQREEMHMIYKRLELLQGKKNKLGIQYNTFLRAVAI